jgi:IMP cyclohydrolase
MNDHKRMIKNMPYPGRIIIIGKDVSDSHVIVLYAVTGRSSSSQARKIEYIHGKALVRPTDERELQKGDRDLLIYPAIQISTGIAVSNGKQTDDIHKSLMTSRNPIQVLSESLESWDYEPDAPNFTPRISGCVHNGKKAAMCIIKKAENNSSIKNFFEFPLIPGKGRYISTYEGKNTDPLPSFKGEPLAIDLPFKNADEAAHSVYHFLRPGPNQADFRVALVCVFSQQYQFKKSQVVIINRQERSG